MLTCDFNVNMTAMKKVYYSRRGDWWVIEEEVGKKKRNMREKLQFLITKLVAKNNCKSKINLNIR